MNNISESSQTYPDLCSSSMQSNFPSSFTVKRKDVLNLKSRLLNHVKNPDYWKILSQFLKGECSKQKYDEAMDIYLQTNEARLLHNDFIRAILFNAHYSPIPPPGIPIPQKKLPDHIKLNLNKKHYKIKKKMLNSYSSVDLGHIPSIEQLSSRVSQLTSIKVDNSAISLLFDELNNYILMVLKICTESVPEISNQSNVTISANHIINVMSSYNELIFKNRRKMLSGSIYNE